MLQLIFFRTKSSSSLYLTENLLKYTAPWSGHCDGGLVLSSIHFAWIKKSQIAQISLFYNTARKLTSCGISSMYSRILSTDVTFDSNSALIRTSQLSICAILNMLFIFNVYAISSMKLILWIFFYTFNEAEIERPASPSFKLSRWITAKRHAKKVVKLPINLKWNLNWRRNSQPLT